MTVPWPPPFPTPRLPPFDFSFDAFQLRIQESIRESRKLRNQPPLIPDQQILLGLEQLPQHYDAPSIVVVPKGFAYAPARHVRTPIEPTMLWSWWLQLEAHCWGDDDPEGRSLLYSFSTATELARQFLVALQSFAGGVAQVRVEGSDFVQHTDTNRRGRVLVLRCAFERHVMIDPPIEVPFSTATTPGVSFSTVVTESTSTVPDAVFTIP